MGVGRPEDFLEGRGNKNGEGQADISLNKE
jgi:hypothetical protein